MPTIIKTVGSKTGAGTGSISGSTLTISAVSAGSFDVGQNITGTGISVDTTITAILTGSGGAGTYTISPSQTVASTTINAARDFTTVPLWVASLPVDLVANGSAQVAEVYDDAEYSYATSIATLPNTYTTSAACNIVIRAAKGRSFKDHANRLTNRLAYDPTKGAAILCTGFSTNNPFQITANNVTVEGLQVKSTNGSGAAGFITGANSFIKDCIIETTVTNATTTILQLVGAHAINVTLVQKHATGGLAGIQGKSGGSMTNCTVVRPNNFATFGRAFTADLPGGVTVKNCAAFGWTDFTFVSNSGTITGSNNVTSSPVAFTGDIVNAVYADQFQQPSSADSIEDFRLKAGSVCINAGVLTATNQYDIVGTYRQTVDVGAYEIEEIANALLVVGPNAGFVGYSSEKFTVLKNGSHATSLTVTPSDNGGGGTFTPAALVIAAGVQAGTFTYSSPTAGAKSITLTNNGSLANPAAITFTASVPDAVAPKFVSARVDNANPSIILVTMDEALANSVPPIGSLAPSGGRTVTAVGAPTGATFPVTVNTPYVYGDPITIAYTKPGADPRLKDAANNAVESFAAQPVTNNIALVRTPIPTPSTAGRRVVRVGIGLDYAGPNELRAYMSSQNLKDNQEILIAEVYDHWTLTGLDFFTVPLAQQDDKCYCIVRPVPGRDESYINPNGPFDYGKDGLEIVVSGSMKIQRGVRFEGFRFRTQGTGTISLGGPNTASGPGVCDLVRNRIIFAGTAANAISSGEFLIPGFITDNLIVRESGTSQIGIGGGTGATVSRNTFVARNGATGPILTIGDNPVRVENNAFIDCGPNPFASHAANLVSGNYTNMAMTTPRAGITAVAGTPFVVNPASDLRPAVGSPLLGNATASANSINDARNQNRGTDPDVGAWQLVPAAALPSGTVTGTPAVKGQQLTVNFSTAGTPISARATLDPASTNPGSAINNLGTVSLGTGTGTAEFSNIAPGNYQMTITVSNDGGTAAVSGTLPVSVLAVSGTPEATVVAPATPTAPRAPTEVSIAAGNGIVTVSFSPPFNTGGKPITSYRIVSSTGLDVTTANLPPIQMGAPNGVALSVQVQAINEIGAGPLSAASNVVTPRVPPVAPSAPTVTSVVAKNRTVVISWTPGSAGDSPITNFIITSSAGKQATTSATASPFTMSVDNNVAATYKVRAVSEVGPGPNSADSASVTPQVTATVYVKTPSGVALGGLTSLKWAWFDQATPDQWLAPTDKGTAETTEAGTGKLELVLPNSARNTGEIGSFVVTNSDGTILMNHQAFYVPVKVN